LTGLRRFASTPARIAGQLRRVTSTHVYVDGAELVALVPAGS
jgi:hypothetical protein